MKRQRRVGAWLLGGFGNVAACTITGARAVARGLAPSVGLVSELPSFDGLDLVPVDGIVFGGHDIRRSDLHREMIEFAERNGSPSREIIGKVRNDLKAATREIKKGFLLNCGAAIDALADADARKDRSSLSALVRRIQRDILAFKKRHRLDTVVVVNLTSTENNSHRVTNLRRADELERRIRDNARDAVTSSVLYAYAAIDLGCPYVNFAASIGSSLPALDELARVRSVAHVGKDAKTGETLFKTVLAPLFAMRNLKVMTWEGHNVLGNRDGQVLADPENVKMKIADKNNVLRGILANQNVHSHTSIDYAPSLGDWKTAWDFIHFEGFLGARMSMQVLWQGCDSLLAAPLVLDLVRFMEHAQRSGRTGVQAQLSCFFKNPYGTTEHNMFKQFEALLSYARLQGAAHGKLNGSLRKSTETARP